MESLGDTDPVRRAPAEHATQASSNALDAMQTFRVGTRKSILARVQTDQIVQALKQAWPDHHFEVHAMSTAGDDDKTTALYKFNEKALWTQALEVSLQKGELDLIVHCLKDMPTQLPMDLELGCITKRGDPRDALVLKASLHGKYGSLAELPAGSVVGTSSLRRSAQIKRFYPHLKVVDVRGNVGTRLAKLDDPQSEYAAIVIAVAGLHRLGMSDRITSYLSRSNGGMLHAVGQGALAIEIRKGDDRVQRLVASIGCERATRAGLAERSLMRTLEGGCSVPIGVETEWVPRKGRSDLEIGVGAKPANEHEKGASVASGEDDGHAVNQQEELTDELIMRAVVVSLDGDEHAETEDRRIIQNVDQADEFGRVVAKQLIDKGADRILEKIQLNRGIIQKQGDA